MATVRVGVYVRQVPSFPGRLRPDPAHANQPDNGTDSVAAAALVPAPLPAASNDRRTAAPRLRPASPSPVRWDTVAAISAGGALGALARYGLSTGWPSGAGEFPWATFVINVSGCLLIGVLMVLVTEVWAAHRLLRPFLGVGILGGYTTFSTYAVETQRLLAAGAVRTALLYLAGTLVAALLAVCLGMTLARLLTGVHPTRGSARRGQRTGREGAAR